MKSFPKEMSLVGVKHPGKIQAIQWCNCREGQHRIALINNRIVLLDHKLELELAMLDLGGEACGCMKIYLDIRHQETKRVIPAFGPYLEKMLQKKRLRSYGKYEVKAAHTTPKVQQLVQLLVRFRCHYLRDIRTIHVTSTGGSPSVNSSWLYRSEIGGDKGLTVRVNVEKDWKKNIYDKGIAIVDDRLVLAQKGSNNNFGDMSVVVMDYDIKSSTFGTRNATIMKAHDKWRFKYMEAQVCHNFHSPYKGLSR